MSTAPKSTENFEYELLLFLSKIYAKNRKCIDRNFHLQLSVSVSKILPNVEAQVQSYLAVVQSQYRCVIVSLTTQICAESCSGHLPYAHQIAESDTEHIPGHVQRSSDYVPLVFDEFRTLDLRPGNVHLPDGYI